MDTSRGLFIGLGRTTNKKTHNTMKNTNTKQSRIAKRQETIDRLLDKGWEIEKRDDCELIILTHFRNEKPLAIGFKGTAKNPWFHYRFNSIQQRIDFIKSRIEFCKKHEVTTSRKSPDAKEHYCVGDVLYDSWGYDQTNVDWFQVTKVKGKSIWLRKIAQNSSDAGNCSYGYTQPRRNEFICPEFRKTVQPGGHVASPLRGSLRKWDGKPQYCSSYH